MPAVFHALSATTNQNKVSGARRVFFVVFACFGLLFFFSSFFFVVDLQITSVGSSIKLEPNLRLACGVGYAVRTSKEAGATVSFTLRRDVIIMRFSGILVDVRNIRGFQ
jgi:hypothetical protein